MLTKDRSLLLIGIFLIPVLIFAEGWILAPSSAAEEVQSIFSYGSGPIEVFIFTDYFCPPCRSIEPYLEKEMLSSVRCAF